MTWIKLDNGFTEHPKILNAGRDAAWLYLAGLCYSSRLLTDGKIPAAMLGRLTDLAKPERHAATLVACELWEVVDDGWKIANYDDHQRTKAEVDAFRDQARERKRRQRAKTPDDVTQMSRRDTTECHGVTRADVTRPCHADVTPVDTDTDTDTDKNFIQSSALLRVSGATLADDEIEQIAKRNGLAADDIGPEWARMIAHIESRNERVANLAGYWRVWTRNLKAATA